jgi:hypothetical protein
MVPSIELYRGPPRCEQRILQWPGYAAAADTTLLLAGALSADCACPIGKYSEY